MFIFLISQEWDKFWSENKKVLEERSARYMGVSVVDKVVLHLENVADEVTAHMVQIHPQKPEHGMRVMRRYNKVRNNALLNRVYGGLIGIFCMSKYAADLILIDTYGHSAIITIYFPTGID